MRERTHIFTRFDNSMILMHVPTLILAQTLILAILAKIKIIWGYLGFFRGFLIKLLPM